ncbi:MULTISPECIES: glycoside hydrolase family 99-like domain-containing protein [unclassified Marichromatium]|uniref:glycosyltransferase WbsX family protein n=1 Tax=unclassified Marichromatium TaxID=2618417 RepID=UPI001CC1E026|nr:glycoside hydrolase family 99-like domain-containing protein [Marichromatium sp. AB32]
MPGAGAMKARMIAFHLPQFHPTPENDAWWGKGFTEWTNVARAARLYPGHYQPHVPADLGFYDLRLPEARQAQADLARAHGIEGFCYYHYWFGGRRILERPVEAILASGEPDFPFCLCWANHSWNTAWQGTDSTLIEQVYPGWDDHGAHFDWLLRAFTDPRYLKVDGKPIFVIYKPDLIPDVAAVIAFWRQRAERAGLPGLHLIGVSHRSERWDPRERGLDASTMQVLPQRDGRIPRRYLGLKLRLALRGNRHQLTIWDYEEMRPSLLRSRPAPWRDYPLVLPNWDNTPRSGMRGLVLHGATPERFRPHLREAIARVAEHPPEERIVFLKAWNEWAEGNHVEPDQRFGTGWLEVIREELAAPSAT